MPWQKRFFKACFIILIFFMPNPPSWSAAKIELPPPQLKQNQAVKIIQKRQSQRHFLSKALNKNQIADLLYAAYGLKVDGVTSATRTVPSAGATYPLEVYLAIGKNSVEGIKEGLYFYADKDHALVLIKDGDLRKELMQASLGQDFIQQAPIVIIIAAQYSRTTGRYGKRGERYVDMEAGHSCQNIYLVATELGLATVEVGAFNDQEIKRVLNLPDNSEPLAIMPVGYPK
jgi:SagB-type dehydrogenase family enzyme